MINPTLSPWLRELPILLSTVLIGIAFLSIWIACHIFTPCPPFATKSPEPISSQETYPVLGAIGFFNKRWDFYRDAVANSKTGSFSFYLGKHPIVGLSGHASRKIFFENKHLDFLEGYRILNPSVPRIPAPINEKTGNSIYEGNEFGKYFHRRITQMLSENSLVKGLPLMKGDIQSKLNDLLKDSSGITDPFDSIYGLVFKLTMRTVGCNDIADDLEQLRTIMSHYEVMDKSFTPLVVYFPWLPTVQGLRRKFSGARIYLAFKRIVDRRRKTGERGNDPLQYLMDQGDNMTQIIGFVVGSLFAGIVNSGITASWMLIYLASQPQWMARARKEITDTAAKYSTNSKASLVDQLDSLPLEIWETKFPFLDMCLKDTIRLQLPAALLRKNISGSEVGIGDEILPNGAIAVYHVSDIHHNPSVYPNPKQWDPSRYFPERAEDKKEAHGFLGWGAGRHPCLGMRFAKLEMNLIVAYFLATFDYELTDGEGRSTTETPEVNMNCYVPAKPEIKVCLKYRRRPAAP